LSRREEAAIIDSFANRVKLIVYAEENPLEVCATIAENVNFGLPTINHLTNPSAHGLPDRHPRQFSKWLCLESSRAVSESFV
jgi:hypothetical protein